MKEYKITVYNEMTGENKKMYITAPEMIDAIESVLDYDVNHAVEDIVKVEKI